MKELLANVCKSFLGSGGHSCCVNSQTNCCSTNTSCRDCTRSALCRSCSRKSMKKGDPNVSVEMEAAKFTVFPTLNQITIKREATELTFSLLEALELCKLLLAAFAERGGGTQKLKEFRNDVDQLIKGVKKSRPSLTNDIIPRVTYPWDMRHRLLSRRRTEPMDVCEGAELTA